MKQNIWVSETPDRQVFEKHDLGKRQTRQSGMKECLTRQKSVLLKIEILQKSILKMLGLID